MRQLLWIVVGLALASCRPEPACDPGQRYELGSCLPGPVETKDAGERDAAMGGDGGESRDASTVDASLDCEPGPGNYEGFGVACQRDSDCPSCVAPTCATAPINQCSRIQCQDDPNACPPDWACTDISAFSMAPGVTHICLKL